MYLIDTNIFLEILLSQKQKDRCKEFLVSNIEHIYISDFSLHSIGVILFRNNKETVFDKFVKDIIQKIKILTLSEELYSDLGKVKEEFGLDFDDAYQFKTAEEYGLSIVTQDKDFEKIAAKIDVTFL
jgi:predicted nucleic acid-binding protein